MHHFKSPNELPETVRGTNPAFLALVCSLDPANLQKDIYDIYGINYTIEVFHK